MIEWTDASPQVFIAFGFGCTMGYGFALRTCLKTANDRIDELKNENIELKKKFGEMQQAFWPLRDRRSKDRGPDDEDGRRKRENHE